LRTIWGAYTALRYAAIMGMASSIYRYSQGSKFHNAPDRGSMGPMEYI
jgi:hypothetical protein